MYAIQSDHPEYPLTRFLKADHVIEFAEKIPDGSWYRISYSGRQIWSGIKGLDLIPARMRLRESAHKVWQELEKFNG